MRSPAAAKITPSGRIAMSATGTEAEVTSAAVPSSRIPQQTSSVRDNDHPGLLHGNAGGVYESRVGSGDGPDQAFRGNGTQESTTDNVQKTGRLGGNIGNVEAGGRCATAVTVVAGLTISRKRPQVAVGFDSSYAVVPDIGDVQAAGRIERHRARSVQHGAEGWTAISCKSGNSRSGDGLGRICLRITGASARAPDRNETEASLPDYQRSLFGKYSEIKSS